LDRRLAFARLVEGAQALEDCGSMCRGALSGAPLQLVAHAAAPPCGGRTLAGRLQLRIELTRGTNGLLAPLIVLFFLSPLFGTPFQLALARVFESIALPFLCTPLSLLLTHLIALASAVAAPSRPSR
jgi:ABC-type amino acid transport system permease subunit